MAIERRNYRKVYSRIWDNPDFQAMPADHKNLALYLLTGPQTNRVGLFRFSFGQAGEHLNLSPAALKKGIEAVCRAFAWEFDARAKVLWIPSWWTFNPVTENPKNLKGYLTDLNDLPRTALIHKFCKQLVGIPAALHALFEGWETALTPMDHRPDSDAITDRTTSTCTKTETQTETETETVAPRKERAASPQPVRPAFEHYDKCFRARYHGKPEYAPGKDGARMARLLRAHGLDEVVRRIDAFFDSPDPWVQRSGHTLDVFFSAGTQTKLVAQMNSPPGLSETARHNFAASEEAERLILENEARRTGTHGHLG